MEATITALYCHKISGRQSEREEHAPLHTSKAIQGRKGIFLLF